uniref:Uncharacterized protein n=1 Tax=Anopheles epiroticus TaxID=199890 RepID=A0A182PEB2_9DIPT
MSSRKSRLSLSKQHKEKDVKTPNARRTSARTSLTWKSPETQKNGDSCEVSPSQGSDYSPMVPMTQDSSFHAINGVSWEWNSPQRLRDQQQVERPVAAKTYSQKLPLRPKYKDVPDTVPKKPTGFNKFISKLNLLMEKENVGDTELNAQELEPPQQEQDQEQELEKEHTQLQIDLPGDSCFLDDFSIEGGTKQSGASAKTQESDDDIFEEHIIETPVKRNTAPNELDDSKLDCLLIEASQTIEQMLNEPISEPTAFSPSPPPPSAPVAVNKKHVETNIPIEMNDSDMDGFLIQASLMVEEKFSDSSQESSSHSNNVQPQRQVKRSGSLRTMTYAPSNDCPKAESKSSVSSSEGKSEITMSQDELKALIEKKRQEALRRLQNNRLRRGIQGPTYHG